MTCDLCETHENVMRLRNGGEICATCRESITHNPLLEGMLEVEPGPLHMDPGAVLLYAEIGQLRRANRKLRAVLVSTWIAALAVAVFAVWVLGIWSDGGQ